MLKSKGVDVAIAPASVGDISNVSTNKEGKYYVLPLILSNRIMIKPVHSDKARKISYVTDIEGNLDYFKRFVKLSEVRFQS